MGRVLVFFVLPASLSIKIIMASFRYCLHSPHPLPALSCRLQFLWLSVYGTVVNGWWVYKLSLSQSVPGFTCACGGHGVKWSGMHWLCAVSVYSRSQKAACYGALYRSVCVCVYLYTVYKKGDRERKGYKDEVRRDRDRDREGIGLQ